MRMAENESGDVGEKEERCLTMLWPNQNKQSTRTRVCLHPRYRHGYEFRAGTIGLSIIILFAYLVSCKCFRNGSDTGNTLALSTMITSRPIPDVWTRWEISAKGNPGNLRSFAAILVIRRALSKLPGIWRKLPKEVFPDEGEK